MSIIISNSIKLSLSGGQFYANSAPGVNITPGLFALSFTTMSATQFAPGPGRGLEEWTNNEWRVDYPYTGSSKAGNCFDKYYRFKWWEIQNDDGSYTWTAFDTQIKDAMDNKRKFHFAVMPLATSEANRPVSGGNLQYPLFLYNQMAAESSSINGGQQGYTGNWTASVGYWIPDWNSNSFLTAWENLQTNIANHITSSSYTPSWSATAVSYSRAIGIIDIRGYGNFGEWHTDPWTAEITTNRICTYSSAKRLIDANLNAFPNFQHVIQHESFGGPNDGNAIPSSSVWYYALTATSSYGPIGWRRDSWGWSGSWFPGQLENNPAVVSGSNLKDLIMNKWKIAPIIGEPIQCCTTDGGVPVYYGDLDREVTLYKLSLLGNGNLQSYTDINTITNIRAAGNKIGYRLIVTGGLAPNSATRGTPFNVTLYWKNTGLTPAYEPWTASYELQNTSTNAIVWSGSSSHVLKLFTGSASVTDSLTVPGSVSAATYRLVLKVKDPNNYLDPLPLALTGSNSFRRADGSYTLVDSFIVV
jgi:hypothetical protein